MAANPIRSLTIEKDYIAILASGHSVLETTKDQYALIREKCFLIGVNYTLCYFNPDEIDALWWNDINVTDWLDKTYQTKPPCTLISRQNAFPRGGTQEYEKVSEWIDYIFDRQQEGCPGNYSMTWILSILNKYFPKKKVLIFGHDAGGEGKWYDKFIDHDFKRRGATYNINHHLIECEKQLVQYIKKDNIFNCNLNSSSNAFQKKTWQEILNDKCSGV